MIFALDDSERAYLLCELLVERYGGRVPWSEVGTPPHPLPRRLVRVQDTKAACARRRRALCAAMTDPIDMNVTDPTTISIGVSA